MKKTYVLCMPILAQGATQILSVSFSRNALNKGAFPWVFAIIFFPCLGRPVRKVYVVMEQTDLRTPLFRTVCWHMPHAVLRLWQTPEIAPEVPPGPTLALHQHIMHQPGGRGRDAEGMELLQPQTKPPPNRCCCGAKIC
jgi:hypothetical protein